MYHIVKHIFVYLFYICHIFVLYLYVVNISIIGDDVYMVTKEQFGVAIKKVREDKHFTVRQTALQGGLYPAYLSQIENGNKNIPKVETLYRIAKGLRITKSDILNMSGIAPLKADQKSRPIDLGQQLEDDDLLLSFEGKELSPEYRHAILSILKTLPDAKKEP